MSHREVVGTDIDGCDAKRHELVRCDVCGTERTIEVAEAQKWKLGDNIDACEYCSKRGLKKRLLGKGVLR